MVNQIEPLIESIDVEAVYDYMKQKRWLTQHTVTEELEKKIAEYLGVKHALMTTSGTTALYLAYLVSKQNSDKNMVYMPSFTMIATANAATHAGYDILFADVNKQLNLDLEELERTHWDMLNAVVFVSINGRAKDIDKIAELCKDKNKILIEDACQSFGSKYKGKFIGTYGDMGCFSLSPHKIFTTGQGGIVVTNRDDLYEQLFMYRDQGRPSANSENYQVAGFNCKFTDLQATVGLSQFSTIEHRRKRKKEIFERYKKNLKNDKLFIDYKDKDFVPWFVDIKHPKRNEIAENLKKHDIGTRIPYLPVHRNKPYIHVWRYTYSDTAFVHTNDVHREGLWLPSSLTLSNDEIDTICEIISEVVR